MRKIEEEYQIVAVEVLTCDICGHPIDWEHAPTHIYCRRELSETRSLSYTIDICNECFKDKIIAYIDPILLDGVKPWTEYNEETGDYSRYITKEVEHLITA